MIVIFGSLNVDMLMTVDALPRPGETVLCPDYVLVPGGKGANQACAAARASGPGGLAVAVAIGAYGMPAPQAFAAAGFGFAYGLWPIAWIIVTAVFLYKIVVKTGQFDIIRASVLSITDDQRLQMLLIGFAFGAFLEGAAGFGAPVAITAALLVGLGFNPLYAAGLCLIANTAPVAFGAMGIPIIVAGQVTGIDLVYPSDADIATVHEAYVGMATAGRVTDAQRYILLGAGRKMMESQGADAIVLASTDLYLALEAHDSGYPTIDAAAVHVAAIFEAASAGSG